MTVERLYGFLDWVEKLKTKRGYSEVALAVMAKAVSLVEWMIAGNEQEITNAMVLKTEAQASLSLNHFAGIKEHKKVFSWWSDESMVVDISPETT